MFKNLVVFKSYATGDIDLGSVIRQILHQGYPLHLADLVWSYFNATDGCNVFVGIF